MPTIKKISRLAQLSVTDAPGYSILPNLCWQLINTHGIKLPTTKCFNLFPMVSELIVLQI